MAWLTVYGSQIEDHIGVWKSVEGQRLPHIAIEVAHPAGGESILKCNRITFIAWRAQVSEHDFLNCRVAQKELRKMRSDEPGSTKYDDTFHVDLVAFVPEFWVAIVMNRCKPECFRPLLV